MSNIRCGKTLKKINMLLYNQIDMGDNIIFFSTISTLHSLSE